MAYGYPYQPGMNYAGANYMQAFPQQTFSQPTMQPGGTQGAAGSNVNWIYVNGVSGAREQIVQPGQTAWMMDNNEPMIYVKSVDAMGSANLRSFRLEEITGKASTPEAALYASAGEVSEMAARLAKLENGYAEIVDVLKGGLKNEPAGADCGKANGK